MSQAACVKVILDMGVRGVATGVLATLENAPAFVGAVELFNDRARAWIHATEQALQMQGIELGSSPQAHPMVRSNVIWGRVAELSERAADLVRRGFVSEPTVQGMIQEDLALLGDVLTRLPNLRPVTPL